jgi:hypothetical protein
MPLRACPQLDGWLEKVSIDAFADFSCALFNLWIRSNVKNIQNWFYVLKILLFPHSHTFRHFALILGQNAASSKGDASKSISVNYLKDWKRSALKH